MDIEKEREAFEAYISTKLPGFKPLVSFTYIDQENKYRRHEAWLDDPCLVKFINDSWEAWQASALREEKLEGCVVVPVELSDDAADGLVSKLFEGFKDIFNSEHRDLSVTEREHLRLKWSRNKARTLQEDYKLLVEAARGGNE